jgi:alpha-glucoside transport system permease protein
MGDLFNTLVTVVFGLGILIIVLLLFYAVASVLPGRWKERGKVTVFLLPALLVTFIGLLVPACRTVYRSLFVDTQIPKFKWFANYGEIFSRKDTRLTVINNLTWVVVGTVATTVFALAIARFADGMKGEKAAKSLVFIPAAISLAGAGIIWRFVYASPPFKVGLLNQITKSIPGLPSSMGGNGDQLWLLERGLGGINPPDTAPGFNTFLLIVVFIWASAGISTVILSAAIKGVPDSLIEAAKVDGATNRQVFYKVTLPYIRATIVTVATLTTIAALKAYDIVAAMTGGNFGTSTLANDFYNTVYLQNREGLGSSMAVLIFFLVIPVIIINRRSQRRAEELMGA